jgi:uncharacterized membrane protein HdeD (DUF308 family)
MSSIPPTTGPELSTAISQSLHNHWGMFLAEGIVLTVLGLAAILVPPLAGLAIAVLLGWLFLIAGVVGLLATFRTRQAPGFTWSLLSAVVALLAGVVLLLAPTQSLITLTLVLTVFFILDGILTIALALSHRQELSGRWQWMLVNGVIDLFLAGVIIAGLPGTLVWALGLIVGIDLMFGGTSLIALALEARKLPAK